MLEEKMRLLESKHKEERERMLSVINTNVLSTNNKLMDMIQKQEKKGYMGQLLDRARDRVGNIDPNILNEYSKLKAAKNGYIEPQVNKMQTNMMPEVRSEHPDVPKSLRTFVPTSDSMKVTDQLMNLKEDIVNTFGIIS
jgi:hypothetical protein